MKNMRLSILAALVLLGMALFLGSIQAEARDFPDRNIDLIVPYNPGGTTDTVARLIAKRLSEEFGVRINVINKSGAGGEIGSLELMKAKADGYTMGILGIADNIVIDGIKDSIKLKDLDLLGQFISVNFSLHKKPDSNFKNMDEIISYAKENPGRITVAESGVAVRLFALMWAEQAGIKITTVSFGSGGDSAAALLGGHVEMAALTPSYIPNLLQGGALTVAISGDYKWPQYPAELYLHDIGYNLGAMSSTPTIALPVGVPTEVRQKYLDALAEMGADQEFKALLEEAGYPWQYMSGTEYAEKFREAVELALQTIRKNIEFFR